jgi:hypothetical protein
MWSPLPSSALPTAIHVTVGARLTLPASTAEETTRGTGRQVRLLRAASFEVLKHLVSRELRAHALTQCGETKGTKPAKASKGTAKVQSTAGAGTVPLTVPATIALAVITALDAGDLATAARLHAEGFGLPVELPAQLGGAFGDVDAIPTPAASRARQAADRQAALLAELEAADDATASPADGGEDDSDESDSDSELLAA